MSRAGCQNEGLSPQCSKGLGFAIYGSLICLCKRTLQGCHLYNQCRSAPQGCCVKESGLLILQLRKTFFLCCHGGASEDAHPDSTFFPVCFLAPRCPVFLVLPLYICCLRQSTCVKAVHSTEQCSVSFATLLYPGTTCSLPTNRQLPSHVLISALRDIPFILSTCSIKIYSLRVCSRYWG